jgi:hypothetical protein
MRFTCVFLTFLICCFASTAFGQLSDGYYTRAEAQLSGPVKTVSGSSYTFRYDSIGEISGTSRLRNYRYNYAENGKISGFQLLSHHNEIYYYETYRYENELLIRADFYNQSPAYLVTDSVIIEQERPQTGKLEGATCFLTIKEIAF